MGFRRGDELASAIFSPTDPIKRMSGGDRGTNYHQRGDDQGDHGHEPDHGATCLSFHCCWVLGATRRSIGGNCWVLVDLESEGGDPIDLKAPHQ